MADRTPRRLARGTNAQVQAYTGPSAEVVVNTETLRLHVQDGATPGGIPVARLSDMGATRKTIGNANDTVSAADTYVALTAALTAPRTLTLPDASTVPGGRSITFADEVGGISATNTLTIVPAPSDTINGAANVALYSDNTNRWSYDPAPLNSLRADASQGLSAAQKQTLRSNLYAAPFDAVAFHGMQINGFMQVNQEFAGTAVTSTGAGTQYLTDGLMVTKSGTVGITSQRVASPFPSRPEIATGQRVRISTAQGAFGSTEYLVLISRFPGRRTRRLAFGSMAAQSVSVGFLIRANVSGRGALTVRNPNVSDPRGYIQTFDYVANTDTFVPLTYPGATAGTWMTDAAAGLELIWSFGAGSGWNATPNQWNAGPAFSTPDVSNLAATLNNEVIISGLVVLPGAELPTVDRLGLLQRDWRDDLRDCQAFYRTSYDPDVAVGTANADGGLWYRMASETTNAIGLQQEWDMPMLKKPTAVTWYSTVTGAAGNVRSGGANLDIAVTSTNAASAKRTGNPIIASAITATGVVAAHYAANARL
jgi:hypothetical protein